MRKTDGGRKWMWWFLAVLVAVQLYLVRELLAVFALFALGFAALTFAVRAETDFLIGSCERRDKRREGYDYNAS